MSCEGRLIYSTGAEAPVGSTLADGLALSAGACHALAGALADQPALELGERGHDGGTRWPVWKSGLVTDLPPDSRYESGAGGQLGIGITS